MIIEPSGWSSTSDYSELRLGADANHYIRGVYGNGMTFYDVNNFTFTDAYDNFLSHIIEKPEINQFKYDFPVVLPQ